MDLHTHQEMPVCLFQHSEAHIRTSTPVCTHPRTLHLYKRLHPYAQTKANTEACACHRVQIDAGAVQDACTEPTEAPLRETKATKYIGAGAAPSIPPESHFLESVSYGGLSESDQSGAGPSGGTGRRGGAWGKGRHQTSFKVSPRGDRNLLQFAKPKRASVGQLWFPPERRNSGLPTPSLGFGASAALAWRVWCSLQCLWWMDRRTSHSGAWDRTTGDGTAAPSRSAWPWCCC